MVPRPPLSAAPGPDPGTVWLARGVVVLAGLGLALVLPFRPPGIPGWQVPAAYLFAIPIAGLLVCMALLLRTGRDKAPLPVLLPGLALIAGGIGFDLVATVLHSPDLAQESNPVARALLDSGHSIPFLYAYGLTMQAGLGLLFCLVWAAFLRHRRTPWTAALVLTWLLVPGALGEGLYRWYLGLGWFQLVPQLPSDDLAQVTAIAPMLAGFVFWCIYKARGGRRTRGR